MASIVKRNKSFAVVYPYHNEAGEKKQKWETYRDENAARKRKEELENPIEFMQNHLRITTFNDLLDEYIQLHGQINWSYATYDSRTGLLNRYVRPMLGAVPLLRMDALLMSRYFASLKNSFVPHPSENIVFEVYKLLHSVFVQAIHWGYFTEHLTGHINLKQPRYRQRNALLHPQVATAINYALYQNNHKMAIMIHLAFSCSMRKGEILGLCWEDIDFERRTISVNKELARISKESIDKLGISAIHFMFTSHERSQSLLILKAPKTSSSIRTVYMTPSLAALLGQWKACSQASHKDKYSLVLAQDNGAPLCPKKSNQAFSQLLAAAELPPVVFHSLRHSSTAYKLILSRGNLKAVQGDNGHAQPNMVLGVYAQINDSDRKKLAEELEQQFCSSLIL